MSKITGEDGPDLEQGTPVQEVSLRLQFNQHQLTFGFVDFEAG